MELVGLDNREVLYRERHVLFSQLLMNLDGAFKVVARAVQLVVKLWADLHLQLPCRFGGRRLVIHQSPLVCLKELFLDWCQTGSMGRTGQL